jgi:transcriptional regulator with XRE-family HTH domain
MNIKSLLLRKIEKQELETELAALDTIGDRLRFLRKNYLKLSRAKLSSEIGIEANMLNKYENGYFEPKAERIKEFADFYNIPVEYITGENIDTLLKEDYFLISNLHMYCWEIDRGFAKIDNRNEIEIALYTADKIIIEALDRLDNKHDEYLYIANLFRNDPAASLLENLNKDTLLSFFDKKMTELLNNPKTPTNSLTSLFRVLDFGMNTRDVLSKKEYRKMIEIVKPLIYSYEKYIKESQLD